MLLSNLFRERRARRTPAWISSFICDSRHLRSCTIRSCSAAHMGATKVGHHLGCLGSLVYRSYRNSKASISDRVALSEIFNVEQASESILDPSFLESSSCLKSETLTSSINFFLKPKLPARRATIFIDGDELSPQVVDTLCTELGVKKKECRIYIARQPNSAPLSPIDTVAPTYTYVPTQLLIEQKAREWMHLFPDEETSAEVAFNLMEDVPNTMEILPQTCLQDVIFMCATNQWKVYYEQIISRHSISDSDIFLVCPAQAQLVIPKKIIPAFS